jgi:crotonobetainyl-CoA:carnitine CoA-transferase CaiB-like acyl-CoA transferase
LHHVQVESAGLALDYDDPNLGTIHAVGPLAKLPQAPPSVDRPAPEPYAHTDEIARAEVAATSRSATGVQLTGPLDGITVIEIASHYAVPAGIAQLADLGARVIKVEPVTGDAYRHAVRGMGHDNLVRAVQGKENLAVNLKDPRGQEIVHRLVARADAFIHNYRLGVPDRLSIDEATLRAINPQLVYQYGASYGSVGPYRRQPAIDHVIAAFAGTTAYQAGDGNPPLKEQGADPTAATGVAASMLLALLARDRTGEGQYVESAMIVSNLYLNAEDAFTYEGKVPRPSVDHRQLGLGATYRLYETAPAGADHQVESWENPDPRWVFLSAVPDDAFARLCAAIEADDLAGDERFATQRLRHEHRDELGAAIEPVFLTRAAPEWESMLGGAGVGCMVADGHSIFGFVHAHPQAQALGMTVTAEHPTLGGRYRRHAPAVRHSDTPGVGGAYCETGEHTREILRELGYDDEQIDDLHDAGVVTWPAQLAERGALV